MPTKKKTKKKTTKPKAKEGRPTGYSKKLADNICEKMIEHGALLIACEKENFGVTYRTILRWAVDEKNFPEFCHMYDRARRILVEAEMDQTILIADENPTITSVVFGTKGRQASVISTDSAGIARNNLRVNTRKFFITKILPKFKDAIDHTVTIVNVDELRKARERALAG